MRDVGREIGGLRHFFADPGRAAVRGFAIKPFAVLLSRFEQARLLCPAPTMTTTTCFFRRQQSECALVPPAEWQVSELCSAQYAAWCRSRC